MKDPNEQNASIAIEEQQAAEVILPSDVEALTESKKESTKGKAKINIESVKESLKKLANKAKVKFIEFLDIKKIYDKLPQKWQERFPENRRLITLPIGIFIVSITLLIFLAVFAPKADKQKQKVNVPVVRIVTAEKSEYRIPVFSQGIVFPKSEIQLISLVRGPVIYVSPNMVDGGVVKEGELLLKVSPRPYEQDKAKAEANLERAKAAQIARQSELRIRGTLRTPAGESQLREVNSAVAAAEADVEGMDDLIEQTSIKAPFTGVLRNTNIQKGQMINTGMPIASIFSTDKAIVNLPLSDRQLILVDIPFQRINETEKNVENTQGKQIENSGAVVGDGLASAGSDILFPSVVFSGQFGDQTYTWKGRVIRSAGGRNELNRLQYVIAEIDAPFASDPEQPQRPPLTPGFFIKAEIQGKLYQDLVKLPRKAIKSNEQLWLVNNENRLFSKRVQLLYRGKEDVYISSGLSGGEKVVVSDLEVFSEGLEVNSIAMEVINAGSIRESAENTSEVVESEE